MWAGKLLTFLYLLTRYGEEIEADFEQYYPKRDLLDIWTGRLSFRKAAVLTMQLPAGCRLWQATGGPKAWDSHDWFSSKIFHSLNIANWQRTEGGRKGTGAPKEPKPPEYTLLREQRASKMDRRAQRFLERQAKMKAIAGKAEREAPRPEPDNT